MFSKSRASLLGAKLSNSLALVVYKAQNIINIVFFFPPSPSLLPSPSLSFFFLQTLHHPRANNLRWLLATLTPVFTDATLFSNGRKTIPSQEDGQAPLISISQKTMPTLPLLRVLLLSRMPARPRQRNRRLYTRP